MAYLFALYSSLRSNSNLKRGQLKDLLSQSVKTGLHPQHMHFSLLIIVRSISTIAIIQISGSVFLFKSSDWLRNYMQKWPAFCSLVGQWVSCHNVLTFKLFFSLIYKSVKMTWCLSHYHCSVTPSADELCAVKHQLGRYALVFVVLVLSFPMTSNSTRWATR